ncbi:hypothetical protein K443DRAFT_6661 [Laccaria amethystina LaAM-08-1]|uniref:Unplaced genomic scaffold K443scaffold_67, whole genome shotgun sequence n=1 Tax=Laccaria amethystina LaAM-08-1 TaxID=1095629 RepID=A0A0C9WSD9_9AGAR|nr:hypothetical protein K443DRAFT_6661 [Laccaria amethystina LaAM-08-1]
MSNTSASPTPEPNPPAVKKYATILDAGSSATRIFVYSWNANDTDKLDSLSKVYPDDKVGKSSTSIVKQKPGFHRLTEGRIKFYLDQLLQGANNFLTEGTNPRVKSGDEVPIYLLATGGMRTLSKEAQEPLLEKAHEVMRDYPVFAPGTRVDNVRVISGKTEGILAWVALNYGDLAFTGHTTQGLFEVGGASVQVAYRTGGGSEANVKICLNGDKAGTDIYSETWDGFGSDAVLEELRNIIWNEAIQAGNSGFLTVGNPCLPRGAPDAHLHGIIGTGDFPTCLALAKRILLEGAKGRPPMPYYPFIQTDSSLFIGIASPYYVYKHFSERPGAGLNVSLPYNRRLFEASALKYCSGFFDGEVTEHSHTWCSKAAWMLTLLHDAENGFGMTKVDVLRGKLRFPVGVQMEKRSSWTLGAAVLIASHGRIKGCNNDTATLSVGDNEKGSTFGYVPQPIITPVKQPYPSYSQMMSAPSTNSLIATDRSASFDPLYSNASVVNVAGFAAVLLVIWIFVNRRLRALRSTPRKVNPSEVKHFIL